MSKCGSPCENWTRCCGYYRPVIQFNDGKKEEVRDRKMFDVGKFIDRLARDPRTKPEDKIPAERPEPVMSV